MLGYEYEFTKLLVKEFWYAPDAPQQFCEAVDWQPILGELDQRVAKKEAIKAESKRAEAERLHQAAPASREAKKPAVPKNMADDITGEFGL
jgi:hypothetical protein